MKVSITNMCAPKFYPCYHNDPAHWNREIDHYAESIVEKRGIDDYEVIEHLRDCSECRLRLEQRVAELNEERRHQDNRGPRHLIRSPHMKLVALVLTGVIVVVGTMGIGDISGSSSPAALTGQGSGDLVLEEGIPQSTDGNDTPESMGQHDQPVALNADPEQHQEPTPSEGAAEAIFTIRLGGPGDQKNHWPSEWAQYPEVEIDKAAFLDESKWPSELPRPDGVWMNLLARVSQAVLLKHGILYDRNSNVVSPDDTANAVDGLIGPGTSISLNKFCESNRLQLSAPSGWVEEQMLWVIKMPCTPDRLRFVR